MIFITRHFNWSVGLVLFLTSQAFADPHVLPFAQRSFAAEIKIEDKIETVRIYYDFDKLEFLSTRYWPMHPENIFHAKKLGLKLREVFVLKNETFALATSLKDQEGPISLIHLQLNNLATTYRFPSIAAAYALTYSLITTVAGLMTPDGLPRAIVLGAGIATTSVTILYLMKNRSQIRRAWRQDKDTLNRRTIGFVADTLRSRETGAIEDVILRYFDGYGLRTASLSEILKTKQLKNCVQEITAQAGSF